MRCKACSPLGASKQQKAIQMSEVQTPAAEAGDEVVTETSDQLAPEAVKNTQGQDEGQPAPEDTGGESPNAEPDDEVSRSKARRDRRKTEMDRLRREAKKAEDENAKLKDQLAEFERRGQDAPPREADFEDYAEYQAALSAHMSMQALDGRERARIEAQSKAHEDQIKALQAQQERELAQSWAAQVADAQARYTDFKKVVSDDLPISLDMARMIASSDVGADVAYHLGQNRGLAAQLSQMTPLEQAMAFGRLEATISRPQPRTQTKAPDPVNPVKAKATAGKDPENMTADEYSKWRESGGTF